MQAGYRRDEALTVFFGIRVVFALVLFALFSTSILMKPNMMLALGGLGARLRPARAWCSRGWRSAAPTASACRSPTRSTCWSSASKPGLGLDQALSARRRRSWRSRIPSCPTSCGSSTSSCAPARPRSEALRNLADRTGVDDLSSLVTMLIQTDKFGTSVAQSLRVYSETLRTKRRQRAEEAAAKTGVKMVFPLVFCIFPAIWVVTIGPAAIKFVTVLFPLDREARSSGGN